MGPSSRSKPLGDGFGADVENEDQASPVARTQTGFAVWHQGDGVVTRTVLIDDWQWPTEAVDAQTTPARDFAR